LISSTSFFWAPASSRISSSTTAQFFVILRVLKRFRRLEEWEDVRPR
jgi:hypothetical protein